MTFVSVLLPVYNGARYLRQSIQSILTQTHKELELIVLDDGSTDDSANIVAALTDPRLRLVRNEANRGLPATLNHGLSLARADLVARQDADDLSHPRRLEKQVAFLDSNPEVGLVGTQAWAIDERSRARGSVEHACEHASLVWELLFDNAFLHTSVTFRRDIVVKEHGGYDESWAYNQDYDLWVRLSSTTRLANLPQRLVAWRSHDASMTRAMGDEAAGANRRILARGLRSVLGEPSPETVELVARAREGMAVSDLRKFLPLMERWRTSYQATVAPPALDDFRRALARQYLKLAFTRRGRSLERVALALWAGRREGRLLLRTLSALAAQRGRLGLGHDPLVSFDVGAL